MATSGVTSGILTVGDIVRAALMELQVLGARETLNQSDAQAVMQRLNWMLKDWQNDGVNLWRMEQVSIPWPAGGASQIDVEGYLDFSEVRLADGDNERVLTRWETADYTALPNKATSGTPTVYSLQQNLVGLTMSLWPVPPDELTLYATASRKIEDVTSLTQNIDVPQQYTRAIIMNLAAEAAKIFGRMSDPNTAHTIAEAKRLYLVMRAADRPASYYMGPTPGRRWGR